MPVTLDQERRYGRLGIEEDFFVNYGFLPLANHLLMHPRIPRRGWTAKRARQAALVLEFVRARRAVHPRDVDAHFAHGKVTNWFGGSTKRARSCWMRCTTVVCCASRGAKAVRGRTRCARARPSTSSAASTWLRE